MKTIIQEHIIEQKTKREIALAHLDNFHVRLSEADEKSLLKYHFTQRIKEFELELVEINGALSALFTLMDELETKNVTPIE